MRRFVIPIFVPFYGCPGRCIFCDQKKITGMNGIPLDEDDVKETISIYLRTKGSGGRWVSTEVAFYGGTFTGIPREKQIRLLEAVRPFIDSKMVDSIRVSTRPDFIDDWTCELLERFSVLRVELGVQSMDNEVLKNIGRGHTKEDTLKAMEILKRRGFSVGVQIMVGLYSSSAEKDIETAREVIRLRPDFVRVYPTLVFRGTELEELMKDGHYTPLDLDSAVEICAKIYALFHEFGIRVIRMGLQPTKQVSLQGEVVAGPFHPSFKSLVLSRIYLERIKETIERLDPLPPNLTLLVSSHNESVVRGMRNDNLKILKERYRFESIAVHRFPPVSGRVLSEHLLHIRDIDSIEPVGY